MAEEGIERSAITKKNHYWFWKVDGEERPQAGEHRQNVDEMTEIA